MAKDNTNGWSSQRKRSERIDAAADDIRSDVDDSLALSLNDMTEEFELLKNDPDLQAERGPEGTLIFLDGDQYCVVGPDFVSVEESDCYAFGSTRQDAIANYAFKIKGEK